MTIFNRDYMGFVPYKQMFLISESLITGVYCICNKIIKIIPSGD